MTAGRRLLAVAALCSATLIGPLTAPAAAHPLGNFTTNTFTGLQLSTDQLSVDYVVDLAEIPTFRARDDMDADGDDTVSPAELQAWARQQCDEAAPLLHVRLDDTPTALTVERATAALADGEAGLSTTRLECELSVAADLGDVERVTFRDATFADRIGWRETVADADGITLADSDVPTASISNRLTDYPSDRLAAPPDQRTAALRLSDDTIVGQLAEAAGVPDGGVTQLDRATTTFTSLVARPQLTVGFALLALLIATGLGAMHALAPGHGKTVMAAYLVGDRGTSRQALGLGVTVAVTHTVGVLLLGVVLSATQVLAPEQLYPWLGAASGVVFSAVGVLLLRRTVRARGHAHTHAHGPDGGDHHHAPADGEPVTWRTLALPGLAGGMVPSPSALLVLLGGIALGRAWFGVSLVVGYGVGMAATLVGAGYLAVRARDRIAAQRDREFWPPLAWLFARLPLVAAVLVIVGGVVITARSLIAV
ncbi:hypothetical protein BH23ACT10_BH23ACT10_05760 [soil metagenome]